MIATITYTQDSKIASVREHWLTRAESEAEEEAAKREMQPQTAAAIRRPPP